MGRKEERARRKLERNPVVECNRVRKKYCPELFQDFGDTQDPRHQSYIEYSNRELFGTLLYKGIAGIESMQSMTFTNLIKKQQQRTCPGLWEGKKGNTCRMQ